MQVRDTLHLEVNLSWSAYCDVNMPLEGLQECLPRLIPTLVSNMVYTEDDESLVDAEDLKYRNKQKSPFWRTTIFPWHMSDVRPLICAFDLLDRILVARDSALS
ncbi:hypothetical protein VPH35_074775 [Triticum aestivum]|uniref:Uncharacterized protein n=1 Tax=Triticum aestivum TaxID=4565 RepID=A0A3B6IY72_WHEAT